MYDLLSTNGRIIDGTGSAPYRADVVEPGAFTGRTPGKVLRAFAD